MTEKSQVSATSDIRVSLGRIEPTRKSLVDAYVLGFSLGLIGAHHFYLRRPWFGIAYLFTFGLLGVGYVVDLFRMPCLVRDVNRKLKHPERKSEKNLTDAYLLWFPFGILGFHLFYLKKPKLGLLYFLTLGGLGIGWLIDLFRMPYLVREVNGRTNNKSRKSTVWAYLLGVSPYGLLGAHHYYLNRPIYGLAYTMTLGLLGVGYIVDWFRMPCLVQRANRVANGIEDRDRKYLDDIYVLWFPFGLLGFHQFYLNRVLWGILYTLTFGLFGIGWLVDGFRLPCLVNEYNQTAEQRRRLIARAENTAISSPVLNVAFTVNPSVMTYPEINVPQGYQGQPQPPIYPPASTQQGSVPSMVNREDISPPTYEESVSTYKPGPPC